MSLVVANSSYQDFRLPEVYGLATFIAGTDSVPSSRNHLMTALVVALLRLR